MISCSPKAVSIPAEPLGFKEHHLKGKKWAFVIEFGLLAALANDKKVISKNEYGLL